MATSLQLASALLPHLAENAVRGKAWVRPYGYYATKLDLPAETHGKAVGMAMHVIGAACVLTKRPVVPLHYLERADKEWQGIFESAYVERTYVLPHWSTLLVASREHVYNEGDFAAIQKALETVIPKYLVHLATPRKLWSFIVKTEASPGTTWLQRALPAYESIVASAQSRRSAP